MAVPDYKSVLLATETALTGYAWPRFSPHPTILIGAEDGLDASGPVVIIDHGNGQAEAAISPGNVSEDAFVLWVTGAIPTTEDRRADSLARSDMANELRDLLKGARQLGGVTQLKIIGRVFTSPTLNGPDAAIYKAVTYVLSFLYFEDN